MNKNNIRDLTPATVVGTTQRSKRRRQWLPIMGMIALMLAACASQPYAVQHISDAQAALSQAQSQYSHIACESSAAPSSICGALADNAADLDRARAALKQGDNIYAAAKAQSVLERVQNLIREQQYVAD